MNYAHKNTQRQYDKYPPNDDMVPIAAAINAWTLVCGCYMGIEQTMKLLIRMRGGVSENKLRGTHDLAYLYSLLDPSERAVVTSYYRVYRSLHNFDTGSIALDTADEFIRQIGDGYTKWRYILVENPEPPKTHLGLMLETWRALAHLAVNRDTMGSRISHSGRLPGKLHHAVPLPCRRERYRLAEGSFGREQWSRVSRIT